MNKTTLPDIEYLRQKYAQFTNTQIKQLYQIIMRNKSNALSVNSVNVSTRGGKKKHIVKKVGVYRSKGGYYYRRYKNGKVKRISKEIYKNII